MDTLITTRSMLLDPIRPDWTIAELIEWLGADDARQHDDALRDPLALIEAELTGSSWAATPSTVALIRSIAGAVRTHGAVRLGDLVRIAQTAPDQAETQPFVRFETAVETGRMPQPQVA